MKTRTILGSMLAALLLSLALANIASATTRYVDNNAVPGNDGLSWQTAFSSVQAGVDAAAPGDEVWVKQGLYVENVVMKDGVALYGGFAGIETGRNFRDPENNPTVVSGDNIPGTTFASVFSIRNAGSGNNVLDGFTIRNGNGTMAGNTFGGGIYCDNATLIATHNIITGNLASSGGGIYIGNSPAVIEGNVIEGNNALNGAGIYLVYAGTYFGGYATIGYNRIEGNEGSVQYGAGICSESYSRTLIHNNIIVRNNGTGIRTGYSDNPVIVNNTIVSNQGAGISSGYGNPTAANNIIAFNLYGLQRSDMRAVRPFNNNIFGNSAGDYYYYPGANWGPFPDLGNISADPLFIDPEGGDYHIKTTSPCVDAGDNTYVSATEDIDGEARIQQGHTLAANAIVDIGADELDARPPYTSCIVIGNHAANGWYPTPPTVTLSATDYGIDNTLTGTGVDYTEYSWDGVNWTMYTGPFTYPYEGESNLRYRSVDKAGNFETVQTRLYRVDQTPPQASIVLTGTAGDNGWYRSAVTVTLSGTDSISGILSKGYSLDNVTWTGYAYPFVYSIPGATTLYYRAMDYAYNFGFNAQQIKIDMVAPSTVATDPANLATAVSRGALIAITFSESIAKGNNVGGITLTYVNNKNQTVPVAITAAVSTTNPAVLQVRLASTGTQLIALTKYTVTVPAGAVKDLAGNPTAAAMTFSFTTGKK